jgi:hypothetical protein
LDVVVVVPNFEVVAAEAVKTSVVPITSDIPVRIESTTNIWDIPDSVPRNKRSVISDIVVVVISFIVDDNVVVVASDVVVDRMVDISTSVVVVVRKGCICNNMVNVTILKLNVYGVARTGFKAADTKGVNPLATIVVPIPFIRIGVMTITSLFRVVIRSSGATKTAVAHPTKQPLNPYRPSFLSCCTVWIVSSFCFCLVRRYIKELDVHVDDIQPKVARVAKYGSANANDPTMTPPTMGELQNMTCPIPRDTQGRNDDAVVVVVVSFVSVAVVTVVGVVVVDSFIPDEYQQGRYEMTFLER